MASSCSDKTNTNYFLPNMAENKVFWDIDDCPVPDNLNATDVSVNIETALKKIGYHGRVTISTYGDLNGVKNDVFKEFDVFEIPIGERDRKLNYMLVNFLKCGIPERFNSKKQNLMLIVGDISKHMGFLMAINALKFGRRYNILLAQPQKASNVLLNVVSTEWIWTSLAIGGEPIDRSESSQRVDNTSSVVGS